MKLNFQEYMNWDYSEHLDKTLVDFFNIVAKLDYLDKGNVFYYIIDFWYSGENITLEGFRRFDLDFSIDENDYFYVRLNNEKKGITSDNWKSINLNKTLKEFIQDTLPDLIRDYKGDKK